jgi:predicted permease
MENLAGDVRYAWRRLRQSPGFSMIVILSLAVGIGASSILFTLVNAAVLRLIPVREAGQLVWFDSGAHGRALSNPFYEQIRGDSHFDGVLAAFATVVNVRGAGPAERAEVELVSGNYFEVLGMNPFAGRWLTEADAHAPVAVVSYAFWQNRMDGESAAVGRTIQVNNMAWTVVGVAPPGFGGLDRAYQRALFVPLGMKPHVTPGWDGLDKPLIAWLSIAGRLRPGTDREAVGGELNGRFHAFQEANLPQDRTLSAAQREMIRGRRIRLEPFGLAVLEKRVASHLSTLGWMVALLLGMTCVNVLGLLLARGAERTREIATRLAIGGSRGAVVRQLLAEAVLLALMGGLAGMAATAALAPLLAARFPLAGAGSRLDVPVDGMVLGFTLAVSMLACCLFGVLPAWQTTKLDLVSALKGAAALPAASRMRHGLLAGQVALSVGLLGAAGLFALNLRNILTQDTGFDRARLLLAEVEPALSGSDGPARLRFYGALQNRLDELAGPSTYISAVMANVAPRSPYHWSSGFAVAGRGRESGPMVRAVAAGPGYLEAMGIPLRSGRLLNERDDAGAPRVAVITESLARREFPNGDALGRRFTADLRSPEETTFEIVGVVGNVDLSNPRSAVEREECVFLPYRQWAFSPQAIVLHARVSETGTFAAAAQALRTAVQEVDPAVAVFDVRSLEQATESLLVSERLTTWLTLFFAGAAVLLCGLGICGVASRELAARMRETAIRMALGGTLTAVMGRVARAPVFAVLAGLGGGVALLVMLAPAMRPLLSEARPNVVMMLGAALFLLLVAVVAIGIPANRVRKVEPGALLRQD